MIRALWTASTGMKAQMTKLDVISNNLANVGTTGFKKSRADFQDLLYQTLKAAGAIIVRLVFALDRMEGARENVEAAGFEFNAILNKDDLGI